MAAAGVLEARGEARGVATGQAEVVANASSAGLDVVERGQLIVPCPLVSRRRPTYSSVGVSPNAASVATPSDAPWVAVHAGVGPAKLLVCWAARTAARCPSAYFIETSASSTNGRDGEWRHELGVARNLASGSAHVIEFDGQSWVRLTLSGESDGEVLPLGRLDLHDASNGTDDCWLVLGESRFAGMERHPPSAGGCERAWPELINERYPGYFPALIDETRADEPPARTLERLGSLLATHSPAKRVALAYGGPSSASMDADPKAFDAMVSTISQSGRVPVLARLPGTSGRAGEGLEAFNRSIAAIEQRHGLAPGPDLAAWFDAHPEQLDADGQPGLEGRRAIAHLWADAVDVWYVPQ